MPDWQAYATEAEATRLKELDIVLTAGKAEKRRIYDRCRKRMEKGTK